MITIKETTKGDLANVKALWADGDVMKFVGFPDGLHETDEGMSDWFDWISSARPIANHYSIFEGSTYCGETFYAIEEAFQNGAEKVWVDPNPDNIKAVALYERLGFVRKPMPDYLIDEDGITSIYMELSRK